MPIYKYEAIDKGGDTVYGSIDAASRHLVKTELERLSLYPVDISEPRDKAKKEPFFVKKPGLSDIALFTRQMSTLMDAGLTVIESLETVLGQSSNQVFSGIISDLKDRVNRGESLSMAMENNQVYFPPMYTSMILAGEQSGKLPNIMGKIADYYEKTIKLRNKIMVSMAYPAVTTVAGTAILIFLLTFIAPTLTEVFAQNSQELPLPTVILMSVSGFFHQYWLTIVLILSVIACGVFKWFKTEKGRSFRDKMILKLPVFGHIAQSIALARFTRTFGILLESGVEVLATFDITGKVTGNSVLNLALSDVKEKVSTGEDIASSLHACDLFPSMIVDMVRAGQKSGRLPELMVKIAEDLDEQVETSLALMTSLIEPVMILIMGVVVAFIVMAVVLPIFEMNQMY